MKVLRKTLRRLLMIIGYVVILNIVSVMWVHASSETSFKQVDNKYIYTYEVQEKEEASFLSSLEKEKTIDNKKATLIGFSFGLLVLNYVRHQSQALYLSSKRWHH